MPCSFPVVCSALMLLLSIPTSTASAERSYSIFKLIRTYLRSSMGQDSLCNLVILSIENSIARSLNFDEVIDTFAEQKDRRKYFS